MPYKDKAKANAANRALYRKNKPYYKRRNKTARAELWRLIETAKNKPCADCGVQYPPYVMDFDHLRDKSFNISGDGRTTGKHRPIAEIAKCDVVCANCHRERTQQRLRSAVTVAPGALNPEE